MNTFLVLSAVLAVALARPEGPFNGHEGQVSVSQSSLGTYSYIVNSKDAYKIEERLLDGTVLGEYSFADAQGTRHTTKYIAGRDGFKLLDADTPVPFSKSVISSVLVGPVAVEDTPEVKAAREEFFAQYRAALARVVV